MDIRMFKDFIKELEKFLSGDGYKDVFKLTKTEKKRCIDIILRNQSIEETAQKRGRSESATKEAIRLAFKKTVDNKDLNDNAGKSFFRYKQKEFLLLVIRYALNDSNFLDFLFNKIKAQKAKIEKERIEIAEKERIEIAEKERIKIAEKEKAFRLPGTRNF